MHYATIKWTDIANGEGVRISLFVSGCTHHCKNCFNQVAWDFNFGIPFDENVQEEILKNLGESYIEGLTLLGGEPMEPQNQEGLLPLVKEAKKRYPNKTIWCYTGNTLDEKTGLFMEKSKNVASTGELLSHIDVLVDGKFVEEKKNIRLKFRGSENQRVIDLPKTLVQKEIVLYME